MKVTPLLPTPPTLTTTFPVVAPVGTGTTILVELQVVGVAAVPLNVTELLLWVDPKFAPVIVTEVPTGPEVGLKLVMLAAGTTVNPTPLLAWAAVVTSTLPVVAPFGTVTPMLVELQLVGVAMTPLKLTVLVPCVAPKFVPVIVTPAPTAPEVLLRVLMTGGATETMKLTPLLGWPATVTVTLPVVAPVGTEATMPVMLQLLGVAAAPLKATVLLP